MRNGTWALAAALLLAGCGKPAPLAVENAWVRLPAVPGRPGAAYFTVRGGGADETLIAVSSPSFQRAELHESMASGMRPLASVAVPAGGTVTFAPGGRHVMLFGISPRATAGAQLSLRLAFADGRQLDTEAKVVGAADPAP